MGRTADPTRARAPFLRRSLLEESIAVHARRGGVAALVLAWCLLQASPGCAPVGESGGEGPGHRAQVLALSPEEELELGREAYREILAEADVLPPEHPAVERVRRVGRRLIAATRIRPLLREINLHEQG